MIVRLRAILNFIYLLQENKVENSKNKPVEEQSTNKNKRYPYEFFILIVSLFVGGIVLILKMVGLF